MILSSAQHNFSYMKLRPRGRSQKLISVNPLLVALIIVIKTHFSSPVMIFLRNGSFLCLKRRPDAIDIRSFLFFSLTIWGSQITTWLTFSIFFKWHQPVDWDVLRLSANSRVLVRGLHSANSIKAPCLRSVLIWVHLSVMYNQKETLKTSFEFSSQ